MIAALFVETAGAYFELPEDSPGSTGALRLRKGAAHWNDGDGWGQGQGADQERNATRVPRPVDSDCCQCHVSGSA